MRRDAQTKEAISHAKAAECRCRAVTKVDKLEANVGGLNKSWSLKVLSGRLGGDVMFVEVLPNQDKVSINCWKAFYYKLKY